MTPREAELLSLLERSNARIAALELENKLLRERIDRLVRKVFGSSSEKLDDAQLRLLFGGEDEAKKPDAPVPPAPEVETRGADKSRKPRRPRVPDHLPVVEEIIDPLPVVEDPEAWRCIGQESADQLDYEPPRYFVRRTVRRKWVLKERPDLPPLAAPAPPRMKEGHLAGPGLLASVVVGKFCDHLPLYRQEWILRARHGIELPRQTLSRWMADAADWVRLIYHSIRSDVTDGGYVQVDETPVSYLVPGNGSTRKGYLWACNRPGGGVFFHWESGSRGADALAKVLPEDYRGWVQCDGYTAYSSYASRRGADISLSHCWAHVRRAFHDAMEAGCRHAALIVSMIRNLYVVEERLRGRKASAKLRTLARETECAPVVARILRILQSWKRRHRHFPASATGRAIQYTLARRTELEAYLHDGRLEIDNNLAENSVRPTVIGRKNYLFFGAKDAGRPAAVLYTLVENCRREGIDPFAYLRDVFTRLGNLTNRNAPEWTPAAWARRHGLGKHAKARKAGCALDA